jgi:hypothetical protein
MAVHPSPGPSGYGISRDEFVSLLRDAKARGRILELLERAGGGLDPDDADDVARAHDVIQADTTLRRAVYQIAMDIWR